MKRGEEVMWEGGRNEARGGSDVEMKKERKEGRKKGIQERKEEREKGREKGRREKGRKGRTYILALSRLLFRAFSLRSCTRVESAFPRSNSLKALSRLNVGLGLVSMIHIAPI